MEYDYNLTDDEGNSSDEAPYLCQPLDFSTITGYVFILITIISVTGNTLLIFALKTYKKQKFITKLFFLNLACSDLIFTATLPFWAYYNLHHWVFGDVLCKFMTAAYLVGLYSSILILTAMTVDRFFTVVLNNSPNNNLRKKKCAIGACVAAWLISVAVSVYDSIQIEVEDDFYCEASSDVGLGYYFQMSLLFLLPFVIIIVCHCVIIKTVLRATNRQRHRVVTVVFSIVVAYIICWGPYNTLLFIESLYKPDSCKAVEWLEITHNICQILSFSHCCLNPLLCLLSQKLRKHVSGLLRGGNVCLTNRQRSTDQTVSGIQTVHMSTAPYSALMLELSNQ